MNAVLIEFLAWRIYERATKSVKGAPPWHSLEVHQQTMWREAAEFYLAKEFGGEDELYAFCVAVLATRVSR